MHSPWGWYCLQGDEMGSWVSGKNFTLLKYKAIHIIHTQIYRLYIMCLNDMASYIEKKYLKSRLKKRWNTILDKGSWEQPIDKRRRRGNEVRQVCKKEKRGVIFRGGWSSWEMLSCFHLSWLRRLLPKPGFIYCETPEGSCCWLKGALSGSLAAETA